MKYIIFDSPEPSVRKIDFSVEGNNKVDKITFKILANQGDVVLNSSMIPAVSVKCDGEGFVDLVEEGDELLFGSENDYLIITWIISREHSQFKNLKVAVSLTDEENDVVWNSGIVEITNKESFKADAQIEIEYPTKIKRILQSINELMSKNDNQDDTLEGIDRQIEEIRSLLQSNDEAMDTLQELVNKIKEIKNLYLALVNGSSIADKASKDSEGTVIHLNYLKKIDVVDSLNNESVEHPLSAKQGKVLKGLIDNIMNILQSDDVDLDEIQELVDYIKDNRDLISQITVKKVSITDIIDDLLTSDDKKPLSAKQGFILKGLIDAIHNTFLPNANNAYDLGSSTHKWKKLYLSGGISDGENTMTIAEIKEVAGGLGTIDEILDKINGEVV